MSLRKKWYISFMQVDSAKSLQFSLSKLGVWLFVITVIIAVMFLATSFNYVWKKQGEMTQLSRLQKENELLRVRMTHFSTQMDSLLIKIRIMEEWEDNMRQERRLPIVNPDVRALGSGGNPYIDPVFLPYCDELHNLYNDNLARINFVTSKVSLTYETHFDLMTKIKSRESLYIATPTIMPTFGRFASAYGYRMHPIRRVRDFHAGIDIANDRGTPIYATANGIITFAGRSGGMGNLIRIDHASGLQTRYAHLDRIIVGVGESVYKGQIIAYMGSSGLSTGYHLHYEVFDMHRRQTRNPINYLNITRDQIEAGSSIDFSWGG